MKRLCKGLGLLVVYTVTTAQYCSPPGSYPPPEGPITIAVPYEAQVRGDFCTMACIQMWRERMYGFDGRYTQQQFYDWVLLNYPAEIEPGIGVGPFGVARTATQFLGKDVRDRYYDTMAGIHQSMADLTVGLRKGNPTIAVVNQGTHAQIVFKTTWRRLSDAIERPEADYVGVHDPLIGSNMTYSAGGWMPWIKVSGDSAIQIGEQSQFQQGSVSLASFNSQGGTYLGPRPGGPGRYRVDGNGHCYWDTYDAGTNQCNTGRYKIGNGGCYWEPNDSGSNQCTPGPTGRYKIVNGKCTWVSSDSGTNQCTPTPSGRFKIAGSTCYWDANDSGPNQCTP